MNIELFFLWNICDIYGIYDLRNANFRWFVLFFVCIICTRASQIGYDHLSSHSSMIQSILHSSQCHRSSTQRTWVYRTWNPRTPITKRYVLCHAWTGRVPCGMPGESSSMVDIWDALDETWILQKLRCWHGRGRRSSAVPKNNRKKQVMVWKLSAHNWEAFCWVTSCWFYGVWMAEVGYLAKRILEPSGRGREFSQ